MAKYQLRYGPYPLTEKAIDREVPSAKGCYALGSKSTSGITVLRVGRSDSDVNARLKWYLDREGYEECTHFFVDVYKTKKDTFEVECFMFHDYEPDLNERHPGRPRGTNHCCPVNDEDECPPCADED